MYADGRILTMAWEVNYGSGSVWTHGLLRESTSCLGHEFELRSWEVVLLRMRFGIPRPARYWPLNFDVILALSLPSACSMVLSLLLGLQLLGLSAVFALDQQLLEHVTSPTMRRYALDSEHKLEKLLESAEVCSSTVHLVAPQLHGYKRFLIRNTTSMSGVSQTRLSTFIFPIMPHFPSMLHSLNQWYIPPYHPFRPQLLGISILHSMMHIIRLIKSNNLSMACQLNSLNWLKLYA